LAAFAMVIAMPKLAQSKLVFVLISILLCALIVLASYYYFVRKPLDVLNLASNSVEELIDGLQDEESEGLGTHSAAWADGFLASDEEPRFRGGILGSAKPNISPVMKGLVRRGVSALPHLMDHLADCRPTRLFIKRFGGFGGMWHSDEYDPRYADKGKQPPGVNKGHRDDRRTVLEYRVRVGDLCYVAIGQIVNRRFNVVRYQPSACIVINSPVESPSLTAAVRTDWGGLTAE
jgi:hypothetical protein